MVALFDTLRSFRLITTTRSLVLFFLLPKDLPEEVIHALLLLWGKRTALVVLVALGS
jgi:hypothetical protein